MATRGPTTARIELSDDEREVLARWARRPSSAQALALRCRVVLACAEAAVTSTSLSVWGSAGGRSEVAAALRCAPPGRAARRAAPGRAALHR